nr:unnamed protein product [Callosobruchus chinensis]
MVSKLVKTKNELKQYITYLKKIIILFKKCITDTLECVGNFSKIESDLAVLKVYLSKFKRKLNKRKSSNRYVQWEEVESCFSKRIKSGIITNINKLFCSHTETTETFCDQSKCCFAGVFIKPQNAETSIKHFVTKNEIIIDNNTNLKEWYKKYVNDKILVKFEEFQEKVSGWALLEILHLKVNINEYNPIGVGVSTFIDLPPFVRNSKSVTNIKNNDPYCFLWSVVCALYPAPKDKNVSRVSSYPHFSKVLKLGNIKFPITLKDIPNFEQLNGLAINVFTVVDKEVAPLLLSKSNCSPRINLLMLSCNNFNTEDSSDSYDNITTYYHFAYIQNLSRLTNMRTRKNKKWFCERCLNHFCTQSKLQNHLEDCRNMNDTRIVLPTNDNNIMKFKNFKYKQIVPFVIYADLESILVGFDDTKNGNTERYQKHEAFSIAYYLKCSYDDSLSKFRLYTGSDCQDWFAKELHRTALELNYIFNNPKPMTPLDSEERQCFSSALTCHICERPFDSNNSNKVMDHDHFTGKFRGAAHNGCKLNYYRKSHAIPVVFHNMTGYDCHFILLSETIINLLPLNNEKYISFTKYVSGTNINFRFIDSFRFMSSSLSKLSSYLDNNQKLVTRKYFSDDSKFELVTRKGVFPKIHNETITDADYSHACHVWQSFQIKNLQEYAELYLKTDVLLLTDVFENFRNMCMKTYKLDALHYYTAPGLAFDAMLKITNVNLELITDIEIATFIQKGIRGGISQCCNRYGEANNPYMGKHYKPDVVMSYLMYYDINNLYGAAMSKHLPYGGFEWVPIENIYHEDILNQPDDSDYGYILEVDLNYPADLFSLHKDLQLCPEHLAPPTSNSEMKKLLTTLCLKFKQAPWIKTYIDLNTELRTRSRNEFEKNFFKLMNNSPYGKTIENVKRYRDIKLVTRWSGRYGARCSDHRNEEIESMAILDISKTFLYDFHYNYIKQQFNDKAKLLYCDTDSLVYHFFIDDIYHHMKKDIFRYDTSDYSENNQFGMPRKNKKVLGLMKDENNGKIMTHFIGLRSKMYTFKVMSTITENDWIVSKKAKGIQRSALKEITFDDYYKCLMDRRQVEIQQNFITTSKHNVYTASQKKVALSPYDDKRMVNYLYTDTLPWAAKKAKQRIVPSPVNTKTHQPSRIRSNISKQLLGSTWGTVHCDGAKSFFASVKSP